MGKKPPKHHFVPEFYLNGFIDPNPDPAYKFNPLIWRGDVVTGDVYPTYPKRCAQQPGYYRIKGLNESEKEDVERYYSKFESKASIGIQKLIKCDPSLNTNDWDGVLFFAATLANRGPKGRCIYNQAREITLSIVGNALASSGTQQARNQLEKIYPGIPFPDEKIAALRELLSTNAIHANDFVKSSAIVLMLKNAIYRLYPTFLMMKWTLVIAPMGHSFLCSDAPVSCLDPEDSSSHVPRSMGNKEAVEVTFPLASHIGLSGNWSASRGVVQADARMIDSFNARTVRHAKSEILGSSRELVEWGMEQHSKSHRKT